MSAVVALVLLAGCAGPDPNAVACTAVGVDGDREWGAATQEQRNLYGEPVLDRRVGWITWDWDFQDVELTTRTSYDGLCAAHREVLDRDEHDATRTFVDVRCDADGRPLAATLRGETLDAALLDDPEPDVWTSGTGAAAWDYTFVGGHPSNIGYEESWGGDASGWAEVWTWEGDELRSVAHTDRAAVALWELTYGYDDAGRLTRIDGWCGEDGDCPVEALPVRRAYDEAGRLVEEGFGADPDVVVYRYGYRGAESLWSRVDRQLADGTSSVPRERSVLCFGAPNTRHAPYQSAEGYPGWSL